MKNALILLSFLTLAGCAADPNNHTMIVLQNPTTKETHECKADGAATWNVYSQTEACAQAYEKLGFKRIGAY